MKTYVLSIMMAVSLSQPNLKSIKKVKVSRLTKSRLNESALDRAGELHLTVKEFSKKYKVPPWLIYGVIMNESNITSVISDHNYGLGQVRCKKSGWSWLTYLKTKGLKVNKCKDLLNRRTNIEATAIILRYNLDLWKGIKGDYKKTLYCLNSYQRGNWQLRKKKFLKYGYTNRAIWYGRKITRKLNVKK